MNNRRTLRLYAAQTVNLDFSQAETFVVDFETSISTMNIKYVTPGKLYVFILIQDGKGQHTIRWSGAINNAGSLDPKPSSITVVCCIGQADGTLSAITGGTWTEE